MSYDHTQRAPIWLLLFGIALLEIGFAVFAKPLPARLVLLSGGLLFLLLASTFAHLRVRSEGRDLLVAFGPLELISKRIPYADIRSVSRGRSRLIDGWGIHWLPGRGWIWNIWGRDCIELELNGKRLRLGTDDPAGLLAHLEQRTPG